MGRNTAGISYQRPYWGRRPSVWVVRLGVATRVRQALGLLDSPLQLQLHFLLAEQTLVTHSVQSHFLAHCVLLLRLSEPDSGLVRHEVGPLTLEKFVRALGFLLPAEEDALRLLRIDPVVLPARDQTGHWNFLKVSRHRLEVRAVLSSEKLCGLLLGCGDVLVEFVPAQDAV